MQRAEVNAAPLTRDEPAVAPAAAVGPVLIITPWYYPALGGVVEVAERLRRGLIRAGVDTHLLVAGQTRRLEPDPERPRVWYLTVPGSAFYRTTARSLLATVIRGPRALWTLARFIREHRIRTVILMYPIAYVWPFLLLRRLLNIRLIASVHGGDVRGYPRWTVLAQWLFRLMLRGAQHVVACSSHLASQLQRTPGADAARVHVVPNPVDVNHFTPPPPSYARRDARPTVVHVSAFAKVKRTLDIVESFADPRLPANSRLVMVGEGPDLEAAVQRADELGISERVHFAGHQADVRPFLWDADLFVLASEAEGSPLVLLEAMACGTPWVATPWGAAAELPSGECGVTVAIGNPERLAAAIGELLRDAPRRAAMGARARERAVEQYAEEEYVKRHLELLGAD